ncbi:MAG: tetratricopeptide repeat protein [Porticoccaceae bacterium]
MSDLLNWFTEHESALSGIAALIAIVAGAVVVSRLMWTRMPGKVKRPAFLSDWRNIGLISLTSFALILLLVLTLGDGDSDTSSALSDISGKPSVAVLPLNNISGDPEQEYLADGIAEDVITLLSRNPNFFVIARNSTFSYKGQSPDIRTVGEELGVRYVVEGSVRKIGERLRVTVQLIEAASGQHVWAEKYDRPYLEIFDLQDEITNGIASALGDEIFSAELARIGEVRPENLDAWGLLMKAQNAYAMYDSESIVIAEQMLREALEVEPDYPLALARLGRLHAEKVIDMYDGDASSDFITASQLADKALRLAPSDTLVMQSVGFTYSMTSRLDEAISLLRRVKQLDPNNAETNAWLGAALGWNGEATVEALALIEQSIAQSPKSPFLDFFELYRGQALFNLDRYAEAEQAYQKAIVLNRRYHWPWMCLAIAQAAQGNIEGARESVREVLKMHPKATLEDYKNALDFVADKGASWIPYIEAAWPTDELPEKVGK